MSSGHHSVVLETGLEKQPMQQRHQAVTWILPVSVSVGCRRKPAITVHQRLGHRNQRHLSYFFVCSTSQVNNVSFFL